MFGMLSGLIGKGKLEGFDLSVVMDLMTGKKVKPRKIAEAVKPILVKAGPSIADAFKHLEAVTGRKPYLVASMEEDEAGNPLPAIHIGVWNDAGQFEFVQSVPLYLVPDLAVDIIETMEAPALLPPASDTAA